MNIIATIRPDKKDKKGNVPIYIHVYEGNRILQKKSIDCKINPDQWDPATRTVKAGPLAMYANALITKEINALNQIVFNARMNDQNVAIALKGEKKRNEDFEKFATVHLSEKGFAPETQRNYLIFIEKLKAYKPGVTIRDIDFSFLQSYEAHLRDTLKNAHNTRANNLKFIESIINAAMKAGIVESNPFKVFKRPRHVNTDRVFLTLDELDRVEAKVSEMNEGLQIVANYFLFMSRTGLRFSDAIAIRDHHIVDDERIVIKTQKTGKATNLFINDRIAPLLRYVLSNRLYLSQVDFNRKLKIIAAIAGINKNLTSHVGRHSFGASLPDMEIPIEVAKELLSHGSTKMTKIYYHLKKSNLDEAMKRFNKKGP